MRLAEELRLPFVSVIDTSGVELSKASEEGAVAGEIARCLAKMVTLETASVCLMLGEGTGGGALALLPADRVISAEHSWLSPLPPEGAAAILHRDVSRAPEVAAAQRVRAVDLRAIGVVDRIVHEDDEDADGRGSFLARVTKTLEHELSRLVDVAPDQRMKERLARYGQVG
jgi:acetyl-CoA carboxylase carboxyl transferase subunit beta